MKKSDAKPIPETHYERFKNRLEEMSTGWRKERNLTIFFLGVATGYRVGDIIGLTIAQIKEALLDGYFEIQESKQYKDWETHMRKHPNSKRKPPKKRSHDIVPQLEKILRDYVKGKKKSEYAFLSQQGAGSKHLTAKSYSDILKEVAEDKSINLKHITGHSLRKTYARRLWDNTRDLEYVRVALGHKSIEVTKRYLGLDDEVKESAAKIAGNKL